MVSQTSELVSEPVERKVPSNDKIIQQYLDEQTHNGIGKGTLTYNLVVLQAVEKLLGQRFSNPTRKDINDCLKALKEGKHRKNDTRTMSDSTLRLYQMVIKKFYNWLLGDGIHPPDCVAWMKQHKSLAQEKKKDVLTKDEVVQIINACSNLRDKALIALLFDSGCRISELLTLELRNIRFVTYGMEITVAGKTGVRVIPIVGDSVVFVRRWLDSRTITSVDSEFVFTRLRAPYNRMTYPDVDFVFKELKQSLKWNKRIHPHLFRHTRATLLASSPAGTEMALNAYMGWQPGSGMVKEYVHLNSQQDMNMKRALLGLPVEEHKPEARPITCSRCKHINVVGSKFCSMCSFALTDDAAIELKNLEELMSQTFSPYIFTGEADKSEHNMMKLLQKGVLKFNVDPKELNDPQIQTAIDRMKSIRKGAREWLKQQEDS